MKSFQIGTIEGKWKNFLPPIQGGHFRRLVPIGPIVTTALEVDSDELRESVDSSASPSPAISPVSSAASVDFQGLSSRSGYKRTSSISSLSSLSSSDLNLETKTEPSYLDQCTENDINLDLSIYPSLDAATQGRIVDKYRLLNERIQAEGLYNCNYTAYMVELTRYCTLFGLCLLFLRWGWYCTSGVFLGLFWHQLVFTAHDAGHVAITHNYITDTVIGIVIADFIGGLSMGWWKRSHNVHHIVTNSPEHDPDIELMPFFAVSHRFFSSLRSTYYDRVMSYDAVARCVVRWQAYLYYPILTVGRFNLYFLSWEYLFLGLGPRKGPARWHRWLEIAGQIFFWIWFGYGMLYRCIPSAWGRFAFVMISHMVTAPLHVQITLSHYAMSTADLGVDESFPQKMLRTTMDVDCPDWMDFVHGGLQFQAVHHLFPRLPRHNLRRAQKLVQEFCDDVGIPYALYGFVDGNKKVIGKLSEVGRQAAIFAECQKSLIERGDFGHHH